MKLVRTFLVAVAIVLAVTTPSFTQGQHFLSHLFVFGDSLSDTGNDLIATSALPVPIPPTQMYYQGRFANGPVTFEYLWSLLRDDAPAFAQPSLSLTTLPAQGAVSFAFGGTGSGFETLTPGGFYAPGLKGQVAMFAAALNGQQAPEDALYAIWTGPNDYPAEPFRPTLRPIEVVGNIAESVIALHRLGARHILVVNLPDTSAPPETLARHNALLKVTLSLLDSTLRDADIIHGNVTGLLEQLIPEFDPSVALVDVLVPPAPGAPYPNSVCLFVDPSTCPAVPTFAMDAKYLFWDAGHPTTAVHERVAESLLGPLRKALRRAGIR